MVTEICQGLNMKRAAIPPMSIPQPTTIGVLCLSISFSG